jgi:hypothetical protein
MRHTHVEVVLKMPADLSSACSAFSVNCGQLWHTLFERSCAKTQSAVKGSPKARRRVRAADIWIQHAGVFSLQARHPPSFLLRIVRYTGSATMERGHGAMLQVLPSGVKHYLAQKRKTEHRSRYRRTL